MHAEQWMELAVNGRASRELIPMGFQPTLPELYRGADGWRVRFFFYGMRLRNGEPALEAPAYRLEFSLASGRPVSFDALAGAGKPLDVFRIDKGGLVFYGGFLLAFFGVWAYCRWKKFSFMRVADIYAPAVAMGHASGRIGCFLQGCCFGKPVHSSWPSVVFPAGSAPAQRYPANPADLYASVRTATDSMPLVPVQLYEAACNFLIALLLLYLLKKVKRPGGVAAIYLAAYAVMRFCMELMRGDHTDHIGVFTPSQTIALFVMLPAAAIVFYFAGRNSAHEPSSGK